MKNENLPFEISEIIFRKLRNEMTSEEEQQLQSWLNSKDANKKLYAKITNEEHIKKKLATYNTYNKPLAWQKVTAKAATKIKPRRFQMQTMLRYAAILLIPLTIGGYFLFHNSFNQKVKQPTAQVQIVSGTQKAILTLGNGEEIELNNSTKKARIPEHQMNILDANNTLKYEIDENLAEIKRSTIYNTLETPKGGEYTIVLVDGTMIKLNAATKLRYPTDFIGDKRTVEIEGEAYFEVAKNKDKPFIVRTGEIEIEVLGTSFNVMAYADEKNIATTLVEGRVKVNSLKETDQVELEIIPGEQAVFEKENNALHSIKVDTRIYTDWMENQFIFENESLESIMRRLGRWYDFETVYKSTEIRNYHFSGTLNRNDNIADILEMIALTTNISFESANKTVTASKL